MRIYWLTAVFVAAASLAFGQLDSDTLTIQASRSVNLQPDQVVFSVTVNSSLNTGLDEILTALQGSGITAANLSSVYDDGGKPARLQWSFTLAVAFTKTKATLASLTSLGPSIEKSGYHLTVYGAGAQFSPELLQSLSCSTKDLIADAQAQAQNVAAAAGFTVGPILGLSDGSSVAVPNQIVPVIAARISLVPNVLQVPPTCFIEAKFKLLRYQ